MKAPPDEVKLSREEGQALIERLQANTLTGADRGLLVKLIQLYFWFTFALRETKINLGRLKRALLSAVRYELAKLRCSACGGVFTAPAPAGAEKYSARAKAVIALGRYSLGLPFYRLEQYQALVGAPVADVTQWELAEQVADCAYPAFAQLEQRAAQGEVIFQDDTHVRMLALLAENRRADATGETLKRRGMFTTGLVAQVGGRVICLYRSGRAHAGDNLRALLAQREAGRDPPIVMSDALAANQRDDDDTLIRCHGLAHGRRQFTDLDEVFPVEADHVIAVLNQVFEHECGHPRSGDAGGAAAGLPPDPWRPPAGRASRVAGTAIPGPPGGTQQ